MKKRKREVEELLVLCIFGVRGASIYRGRKVRGLGCEGVVGEQSPPSTPITTPNVHKFVPNVHEPPTLNASRCCSCRKNLHVFGPLGFTKSFLIFKTDLRYSVFATLVSLVICWPDTCRPLL